MKKTLILLAALATAGTAFAQAPAVKTTGSDANQNALHQHLEAQGGKMVGKNPAQKADHKAAKMAKDLGLTADQEAKVEKLMLDHEQENTALKAKYATDKKAGHSAMKAAHERYEAQLKTVLTPEQYAKLDKMKAEHHGHGKDGGKMKAKA